MTIEELLIQNLHLLDYSPPLDSTTTFGPGLFQKPNEKALYDILYFLFLKLKPHHYKHEFQFCWPVVPSVKTAFKRKVMELLVELEKKEELPTGSSQLSRINSASGPRTIDLVWHFSTLVVRKTIQKFSDYSFVDPPSDHFDAGTYQRTERSYQNPKNMEFLLQDMIARTNIEAMKFKSFCHKTVECQSAWTHYAQIMSEQRLNLQERIRQIQNKQSELSETMDTCVVSELEQMKRSQQLERFKQDMGKIAAVRKYNLDQEEQKLVQLCKKSSSFFHSEDIDIQSVSDITQLVGSFRAKLEALRVLLRKAGSSAHQYQDSDGLKMKIPGQVVMIESLLGEIREVLAEVRKQTNALAQARYYDSVEGLMQSSIAEGNPTSIGLLPPSPNNPSDIAFTPAKNNPSKISLSKHGISSLASSVRKHVWSATPKRSLKTTEESPYPACRLSFNK